MSRRTRDRMTRRFLKKMAELYPDPPPGGWLTLEEALARLPSYPQAKAGRAQARRPPQHAPKLAR